MGNTNKVLLLTEKTMAEMPVNFSENYNTHIICLRGNVRFKFNHKEYLAQKDDFIFWLKGMAVSDFRASKNFKCVVLLVEDNLLTENLPDLGTSINARLYSRENPVMPLSSEVEKENCLLNFQMLYAKSLETNHTYFTELLNAQMKIFLLEMWHLFMKNYEQKQHSLQSGNTFEQFIHLVQNHCKEERNVNYYANLLHITPRYLTKLCRKHSDFSATEWIQKITVERILLLMENKNLTIKEISDDMNFSAYTFFSRYFKKVTGTTPTEYRKRLQ